MKYFFTLALLSVLLLACSGSGDSTSGNDSGKAESKPVAAANKEDGAKIYKQYCVTCHGLYGDMGASGAFDLTTSTLTKEQRVEVITKGRNLMTAFEALLTPEKIDAVADYVETLRK